jgi:integrase
LGEHLSIRPVDIHADGAGYALSAVPEKQKSDKKATRTLVAIPASTADKLRACCFDAVIPKERGVFDINRSRVFQIIQGALKRAGIQRPDKVGSVHVLRHSGAIARLRINRNPVLTQKQLRHRGLAMTMRYLLTISDEEALRANQEVDSRL